MGFVYALYAYIYVRRRLEDCGNERAKEGGLRE